MSIWSLTLYIGGLGDGLFTDDTRDFDLSSATNAATGFGTHFTDYDNDGWLDFIVGNGAVNTAGRARIEGDLPLDQPNQLFQNLSGSGFADVSIQAGSGITRSEVTRGLALADIDDDGDEDVLLTNNHGPARLLLNVVGQDQNWIGVRVWDERFQRDALGVRVILILSDGSTRISEVSVDGSYGSSSDPRVLFGLGPATDDGDGGVVAEELKATWPDGWQTSISVDATRRYFELRRPDDHGSTLAN